MLAGIYNTVAESSFAQKLKSRLTSPQLPEPISELPIFGITLDAIDAFIVRSGGREFLEDKTTAEVCEFLKPLTLDALTGSLSYCELLTKENSDTPLDLKALVGEANVYVSHSWQSPFLEVIAELRSHLVSMTSTTTITATTAPYYIWFNLFSNNMHRELSIAPDRWLNAYCELIKRIEHTLFMFVAKKQGLDIQGNEEKENPVITAESVMNVLFTRVWCIFELVCALRQNKIIQFVLSNNQRQDLLQYIASSPESFLKVLETNVVIEHANCESASDKKNIIKALENLNYSSMVRDMIKETTIDLLKKSLFLDFGNTNTKKCTDEHNQTILSSAEEIEYRCAKCIALGHVLFSCGSKYCSDAIVQYELCIDTLTTLVFPHAHMQLINAHLGLARIYTFQGDEASPDFYEFFSNLSDGTWNSLREPMHDNYKASFEHHKIALDLRLQFGYPSAQESYGMLAIMKQKLGDPKAANDFYAKAVNFGHKGYFYDDHDRNHMNNLKEIAEIYHNMGLVEAGREAGQRDFTAAHLLFDKAQKIFEDHKAKLELAGNDLLRVRMYEDIAQIHSEEPAYLKMHDKFAKAQEICHEWNNKRGSNHNHLGLTTAAAMYKKQAYAYAFRMQPKPDLKKALELYEKARSIDSEYEEHEQLSWYEARFADIPKHCRNLYYDMSILCANAQKFPEAVEYFAKYQEFALNKTDTAFYYEFPLPEKMKCDKAIDPHPAYQYEEDILDYYASNIYKEHQGELMELLHRYEDLAKMFKYLGHNHNIQSKTIENIEKRLYYAIKAHSIYEKMVSTYLTRRYKVIGVDITDRAMEAFETIVAATNTAHVSHCLQDKHELYKLACYFRELAYLLFDAEKYEDAQGHISKAIDLFTEEAKGNGDGEHENVEVVEASDHNDIDLAECFSLYAHICLLLSSHVERRVGLVIEYYEKAIIIRTKVCQDLMDFGRSQSENEIISQLYKLIGFAYEEMRDFRKAIEGFEKAIDIQKNHLKLNETHTDVCDTYGHMARIYNEMGDISEQEKYRNLATKSDSILGFGAKLYEGSAIRLGIQKDKPALKCLAIASNYVLKIRRDSVHKAEIDEKRAAERRTEGITTQPSSPKRTQVSISANADSMQMRSAIDDDSQEGQSFISMIGTSIKHKVGELLTDKAKLKEKGVKLVCSNIGTVVGGGLTICGMPQFASYGVIAGGWVGNALESPLSQFVETLQDRFQDEDQGVGVGVGEGAGEKAEEGEKEED